MKKLIKILEDDHDIRDICSYLLSDEGYCVLGFENVASFIAQESVPSLFLLDIQLPDGNGLDVCKQLKNDPRFSNIPVIIMSANRSMFGMMKGCLADAFIDKPFDINKLIEKVSILTK